MPHAGKKVESITGLSPGQAGAEQAKMWLRVKTELDPGLRKTEQDEANISEDP